MQQMVVPDQCNCATDAIAVASLQEREENVRIDVLMCFSRLLDTAAAADARRGGSRRSSSAAAVGAAAGAGEVGKAAAAAQQAGRGARAVDTLRGKLPAVVKAAQRQVSLTAL
jgi:hypothetical protein